MQCWVFKKTFISAENKWLLGKKAILLGAHAPAAAPPSAGQWGWYRSFAQASSIVCLPKGVWTMNLEWHGIIKELVLAFLHS